MPDSALTPTDEPTRPRAMTIEEFFPPKGHRYLTDERIEAFRQMALASSEVTLPSFTVMEIVCDLRNMAMELADG